MEFIKDTDLFNEILSLADKVIDRSIKLPEKVFRENIEDFLFIDFDRIFTEEFFNKINKFIVNTSESRWYFAVLYPDPQDVFYKYFGKYSVFEINTNDKYEDYWHIVGEEPIEEPFEAIFYEGRKIIMFSDSSNWGIYVDRDFELGVVGFSSKNLTKEFVNVFDKENAFVLNEAILNFLVPAYGSLHLIPEKIRKKLANNYT